MMPEFIFFQHEADMWARERHAPESDAPDQPRRDEAAAPGRDTPLRGLMRWLGWRGPDTERTPEKEIA